MLTAIDTHIIPPVAPFIEAAFVDYFINILHNALNFHNLSSLIRRNYMAAVQYSGERYRILRIQVVQPFPKAAVMATVLIGYVTKTGTTKEIAERIGTRLTDKAISVQVKELGTVTSIEAFDAVILGSPINGMKLLPAFDSFVQSHPGLIGKTMGLFAVSYIHDHGRTFFRGLIQGSLRKARLKMQAKHSAVFGGRIDKPMPAAARWLFGLQSGMPVDIRNWNDIERWADNLAGELCAGTKAS